MLPEAQVIHLREVAANFLQRIEDLEAKMLPTTPPKVLQERWKAVSENVQKIQEDKELCAKTYVQVSNSWEAFKDNAELKKVTETSYQRGKYDQDEKFLEEVVFGWENE